jgi:curved DNA-binding protein CbpA
VEARLALSATADHYIVLGLDRTASRGRIRDAYYGLARRYHPDRFRSGPLEELRERIESYFTQVTEAYNTLYSPSLRAEYDEQLMSARRPDAGREGDTAFLARQNFLRGRQLLEKKRLGEALTFFDNAVSLDDGVAEYHLELGRLLARSAKRWGDAEHHLITAAHLNPSLAAAYLGLGDLYRRDGRAADAARMLREVLRWEPGNAQASTLLASLGVTPAESKPGELLQAVLKN